MTATPHFDTGRPHAARVYDYWLNGKSNYPVDAEAAERVAKVWPGVRLGAQLNREFMHRATRWLASEVGIDQFLDIGSGIPTEPNLHQVAQAAVPDARVVYVDNDPVVLQYAHEMLGTGPQGRTAYVQADFTDPEAILDSAELHATLDLDRPVGLSLIALLHFISDEDGAYDIVRRLMAALAPGSYLVISHATADFDPDLFTRVVEAYQSTVTQGRLRSSAEVAHFFRGLEMVDPGVVVAHRWRPDPSRPQPDITDAELSLYGGVGRKP